MASHNDLGSYGEKLALEYLVSHGYKILETNWQFKHLEIDIIAKKEAFIVFIEVKTRKTSYFGEPYTFVTVSKQKNIINAANGYIDRFNIKEETRFDIISVLYNNQQKDIQHIEDAYYPRI